MRNDAPRNAAPQTDSAGAGRAREWALLGEWLAGSPSLLGEVELGVLRERLVFVGRARASLAALEAALVAEVARRDGDAAAAELLRRDQKRSRAGARKAVKTAAQLVWAPQVARKLAAGAITAEAAGLILDAAAEAPVDQTALLDAAEAEPDDLFRRTVKDHINERTSEQALQARRERQYAKRRASISEQPDGMVHLFADLDPLAGARVRTALFAKADELFRRENPQQRSTPPQRLADALHQLLTTHTRHSHTSSGSGGGNGTDHSDTNSGNTSGTNTGNTSRGGTTGGGDTHTRNATNDGGDTHTRNATNGGGTTGGGRSGGPGAAPAVELLVLADYDVVHDRLQNARLSDGTRLTEAETLAIACDAKILPGIFNKHTTNVILGRSHRKVSPRLRKRLVARDRGCVGCGAHEQICEVHHIDHWAHGGATDYDNTCLLCWRCHHIRAHLHGEVITRHPNGTLTLAPDKSPDRPTQKHPPDRPPQKHPSGRAAGTPQNQPERHPPDRPPGRAADTSRRLTAEPTGRAPTGPNRRPTRPTGDAPTGPLGEAPPGRPNDHPGQHPSDRSGKHPPSHRSGEAGAQPPGKHPPAPPDRPTCAMSPPREP